MRYTLKQTKTLLWYSHLVHFSSRIVLLNIWLFSIAFFLEGLEGAENIAATYHIHPNTYYICV